MPTAAPATVFDGIVEKLNILTQNANFNEFGLNSVRRDAEKLLKVDQALGFCALGMIACLEDDVELMKKYHELSIQYSSHPGFLYNYGKSLLKYGLPDEAFPFLEQAVKGSPGDNDWLVAIIEEAYFIGKIDVFVKYKKYWENAHQGKEFNLSSLDTPLLEYFSSTLTLIDKSIEDQDDALVNPNEKTMLLAASLVEGIEVEDD